MDGEQLRRHNEFLRSLLCLPKKIVSLHGTENSIPEFVLHDLCSKNVFNVCKAAYFVDNPDFDCLKGIAGFSRAQAYEDDIWTAAPLFTNHMKNCEFNQSVKSIAMKSLKKNSAKDQALEAISEQLHLQKPHYYTWDMKHDNHGVLLVEKDQETHMSEDDILSGLHFLGLCPVH